MAAPPIRHRRSHLILASMMVGTRLHAWAAMGQATGTSNSSLLGMFVHQYKSASFLLTSCASGWGIW